MPIIQSLLSAGAAIGRFFTGTVAPTAARVAAAPAVRGAGIIAAGTLAGTLGAQALTGGFGGGQATAQSLAAQGFTPIRPLSGGRVLVQTPDGGIGIISRMGRLTNPTVLVPAGSAVPAGGTLVSMSADGSLIGFTLRRKRRPFASELRRVRAVLGSVNALHRAMQPKKRRSS